MAGSGSGPVWMLFVLAPLVAIPVVATVGMPNFGPFSHAADEGEAIDWDDSGRHAADFDEPRPESRSKKRGADDLYAAVSEKKSSSRAEENRPLNRDVPGQRRPSGTGARSPIAQPEDLGRWGNRPASPGRSSPSGARDDEDSGDEPVIPDRTPPSMDDFDRDVFEKSPSDRRSKSSNGRGSRRDADVPAGKSGRKPVGSGAEEMSQADQADWQSAMRRLKALGVKKYRIDVQIEQKDFVFVCQFDSPGNPRVSRRFEAEADTPLEAVQNGLAQIEEWIAKGGVNRSRRASRDVE